MSWVAIDTGPSDSWSSVVRPVVADLSGVNGATGAGHATFVYIRQLSGVSAVAAARSITPSLAGLPSNVPATGALGEFIVYATPFITLDLTTLPLTGGTGTLGNQRTKALATRSAASVARTVGAVVTEGGDTEITLGLVGVAAVADNGDLGDTAQKQIPAVSATTNVATINEKTDKALTTVPSSAAAGTAVYNTERPVISVGASTAVGSPTDKITVALTGNSAAATAGTIVYLLRSVYNLTITAATGGAATLNYFTGAATNLAVSTTGTYIAGFTDITVTVNAGVTIYSNSVADAALTLFMTEGYSLEEQDTLAFINNGNIIGKGGNAGTWPAPPYSAGAPAQYIFPQVGGDALIIWGYPLVSGTGYLLVTINNTGKIFAGGGGAGTIGGSNGGVGGGGGAGGGAGGVGLYYNYYDDFNYTAGGAGGALGAAGSNGTTTGTVGSVGSTPGVYAASGGGGGNNLTTTTGAVAVTDLWSGNNVATRGLGGNAGGSGAAWVTDGIRMAAGGGGGWGGRGGYAGLAGGNGVYTLTSGAGGSNGSAGGNAFTNTTAGANGGNALYFDGFLNDFTNTGTIYGFNTLA